MAGSQEISSSFVEGLEDISEDEQLKMALEMSKNDVYGQSGDFQPSSTNMSVDSNRSGAGQLEFDEWIRTPAEDRLQLLTGAGGGTSENVSESSSEDVKVISANDDTYVSDNEDEDEVLKRIIEQSKHDLFLSDEEKTKIALEQSELDAACNVPMDTLDENEQLEAAIKMSLGATYERLHRYPSIPISIPRSHSSSVSPMKTDSIVPTTIQLPSTTTPPLISPPLSSSPQNSISNPSVRPKSRPTSLPTNYKDTLRKEVKETSSVLSINIEESISKVLLPPSSPPAVMHFSPPPSPPPSAVHYQPPPVVHYQPPPAVHYQPPPVPSTLQSPSRPCPLPSRVKNQLNIATSPNRFSPLAASPTSPSRLGQHSFPPLTEDQQLEMALKMSQEEAEGMKMEKDARQMTEEDQMKLAIRLSRSESASTVGTTRPPGRQKRASGSGSVLHPHQGVRSLAPLAPSHSSPSLPSQLSQKKKTSLPSLPSTSQSTSTTTPQTPQGDPRVIVVDGSNVGMAMGKNQQFRAQALSIVYAWFSSKGHQVVIFLPRSRWNRTRGKDKELLDTLEKADILYFTPSRRTETVCWDSYDDRYIVKYAAQQKAIIVTNDNYRDLIAESAEFRDQIENRLLPFLFVKEQFFPPEDPMGKNGPMLAEFLRH